MSKVKFVVDSLDCIREFEALVNDEKLATINPTFSGKRLIIGIKEEEDISLKDKLREIVRPCICGSKWSDLVNYYYDFLQYLYEKYCKIGRTEIIILYYRNIVEEFSISDLEGGNLLSRIDKWLNDILSKIEKEVKLETILPLPISGERFGLKINKVPIWIEDNRLSIGYISEDFYESFVLTSLYNNNDVVKKSLDIIMEQYGIEKIVTAASYELKICEGKMITPYKL